MCRSVRIEKIDTSDTRVSKAFPPPPPPPPSPPPPSILFFFGLPPPPPSFRWHPRTVYADIVGTPTQGRARSSYKIIVQFNAFSTAVPIWGQTILIPRDLSPKRDWGPKRVKRRPNRLDPPILLKLRISHCVQERTLASVRVFDLYHTSLMSRAPIACVHTERNYVIFGGSSVETVSI